MGNRAVITQSTSDNAPAIYLHWNGGRSSVEAFLSVARKRGISGSGEGVIDAIADICREYLGGSVYREEYGRTDRDNWDNGVYVINESLRISQRLYFENKREQIDPEQKAAIIAELESELC